MKIRVTIETIDDEGSRAVHSHDNLDSEEFVSWEDCAMTVAVVVEHAFPVPEEAFREMLEYHLGGKMTSAPPANADDATSTSHDRPLPTGRS